MAVAWIRWLAGFGLALLSVWVIGAEFQRVVPSGALWDFGSFVASGRAAAEGLNPYGVYPLTLRVELPGFDSWNPNLNPPISALLFQLFDLAEPEVSFRVWRWISVAFYVATLLLLFDRYKAHRTLPIMLWALALAGFWDTLFLGQIYLPLVFAAVAAWLLLERGEGFLAGVLIGVVVAMKPNFLVWPALLFLAGYRRPALAAVATAAVISAIPLLLYGPEVYRQWFELIASDRDRALFLTNASFAGLAARAGLSALGTVASLGLLLALAAWAFWRKPSVLRASALALVASLLASPLGWIQYTLFLLPVLVSEWRSPGVKIVGLMLIVPVPFVIDRLGTPALTQLTTGSVYGWSLVLLLGLLLAPEWRLRRSRRRAPEPAPAPLPA